MSLYEKAWQAVDARVAAAARAVGRDPGSIRVLAASKSVPIEAIRAAHALGQRAFGRRNVGSHRKIATLSALDGIEWHLIGPLQSNKARAAALNFSWVQSVDRLQIAERLAAARGNELPPLNICVQVNISGEASKSGCAPHAALDLARRVAQQRGLVLRGFMGIAEETDDIGRQRTQFHCAGALFDLRVHPLGLPRHAMVGCRRPGMSRDA
jgi:pyridoxal phosphate enzyme (YggS family)